jgi:hypothetical protein
MVENALKTERDECQFYFIFNIDMDMSYMRVLHITVAHRASHK